MPVKPLSKAFVSASFTVFLGWLELVLARAIGCLAMLLAFSKGSPSQSHALLLSVRATCGESS